MIACQTRDDRMTVARRRAILCWPLAGLALGGLGRPGVARGAAQVPPFPLWVGRTALLAGDGAAARLLLSEDGTGLMSVRLFFLCRALPIRHWQVAEDGMSVRYSRASALDAGRLVTGEAHILPAERRLVWVEAARHLAQFEGFLAADAAMRCG